MRSKASAGGRMDRFSQLFFVQLNRLMLEKSEYNREKKDLKVFNKGHIVETKVSGKNCLIDVVVVVVNR